MTYYLPKDSSSGQSPSQAIVQEPAEMEIADLKIFWGSEICRLEYLVHLLDTGRVKDDVAVPRP
ncbi:MAG: hypothetical protein ACRDFX_07810 [Chloroflexota bacterium]